ncbi:MAG TPA: ABC transporter substrate-binding protein [Allosphingosinicella sp.]|nr:ABC transporter substrate-binding protein [Allosphingosinicella sp.]
MRAFVFASAISLALAGAAGAAPRRVASLNLCTDELLIMLGDPRQIVSVTHLSQQEAETPLWRAARRHARNDGSLLSVAPLRPELVLTMGGGGRDSARIAARLGIRTLDLPYPQSLADVRSSIARVSGALGRPAAGRILLARIAGLQRSRPAAQADTLWLGGGGRTLPASGLAAEWMALAGFRQRPVRGDRIGLEQLLVRPPAIILRSDYRAGQYSGEQKWLAHPLARNVKARTLRTDGRLWTCMGPALAAEIARLRGVAR